MSHRTNWRVLETFDPIPGDAPGLRDAAGDYDRIKDAIITAREELERVISGKLDTEMLSDAVDAIRGDAKSVRDGLGNLSGRYSVAALELNKYADELVTAQTMADEAERDAQNAQAALDDATASVNQYDGLIHTQQKLTSKLENYSGDPELAPTQIQIDSAHKSLTQFSNRLVDAQQDQTRAWAQLASAREKLNLARARRDAAAYNAAQSILNQINNDGQNDTWWDNWGKKIADFIASVASDFIDAVKSVADALIKLAKAFEQLGHLLYDLAAGKISLDEAAAQLSEVFDQVMSAIAELGQALSSICATLALVLAFVPGAAAVLGTISKIASLTATIAQGVLALKHGLVDGQWNDALHFGLDIVVSAITTVVSVGIKNIGKGLVSARMSAVGSGMKVTEVSGTKALGKTLQFTAKNTKLELGGMLKHPLSAMNPMSAYSPHKQALMTQTFQSMGLSKYAAQVVSTGVSNPHLVKHAGELFGHGADKVQKSIDIQIDIHVPKNVTELSGLSSAIPQSALLTTQTVITIG